MSKANKKYLNLHYSEDNYEVRVFFPDTYKL